MKDGEVADPPEFSVAVDHDLSTSLYVRVLGAVGIDSSGYLVNPAMFGASLAPAFISCWNEAGNYDSSLKYNLLILKLKTSLTGCAYDNPAIYAEPQTYLKQKVQMRLTTAPNPRISPVYIYFFDPGDETFAGDVDFKFYVQSILPLGTTIGDQEVVDLLLETKINSCWNIPEYLGMSYNGDHFELLLYNRIWSDRGDTNKICDPRIDEMPELKVEFSYKTKEKRTLKLTEKDFTVLDNGRYAYFMEFDIYEDWVSEEVLLDTDGDKVDPIVGDRFVLSGKYPVQFVEPDSCFEFMDLIQVEYNDDNHVFVKTDRQYWCKPDQTDPEYRVVVYALNQDPDQDGDYPYCNMTYIPKKGYYENTDCELEIGFVINFTIFKPDTFINEHDEWETGELIKFSTLVKVVDSRYDYTYIIVVSVVCGVAIVSGVVGFLFWLYKKGHKPGKIEEDTLGFSDTTPFLPNVQGGEISDLPAPPRPERPKRSLFGHKVKRDKAFNEELFSTIPAPPTKK